MSSYDIIFAGGGATACVTAGRLAETFPNLKILILEAGPHSEELYYHIQPGRHFNNLILPRLDIFSLHFGQGGKVTERTHLVPSGRALGGGSSVNFAMYMRPAPSDFDDWETIYGNKGWSSKEIIPLLKKAETFQPNLNHPSHGSTGPVKISYASAGNNIGVEIIKVGSTVQGTIATDDLNDFSQHSINAWGPMARYIDGITGRRSDTAHNYIYNNKHKNLTVLTRAKVRRVVFEGTKAVGVEYINDEAGRAKGSPEPIVIKASSLVVLSAGAFGSPPILERSGVGVAQILKKNGIEQVVDLPGVGENYMDHNLVMANFHSSDDAVTMDIPFRGSEEETKPLHEQWLKDGQGLLSNNGIDAGIKLRPSKSELESMSPAFDKRWKSFYADKPDKPVIVMTGMCSYAGLNPAVPRGSYYNVSYYSAHPASTGHVHITSATDVYSPLDFALNFLTDEADAIILRWAYKKSREVARRMKYFRGELVIAHPVFPEDSAVITGRETMPVAIDAPELVYTEEDDKAIDKFHRQSVETTWHSMGTCAMKAREKGGVVDSRLNVYGTSNLKVADCSITPGTVGANTYSTALGIGEKAAVIIAEELGIKKLD